jgi:hypothetical protein
MTKITYELQFINSFRHDIVFTDFEKAKLEVKAQRKTGQQVRLVKVVREEMEI